jgi:hypothetical protein
MSYRKPGPRVSQRFVTWTLLLVGVLALFRLYTYYKEAAAPIPPGVLLGGVDLSSYKERAAIRAQLEPIFTQAIGVHFEDHLLILDPAQVGFAIEADRTIDEAARYLEGLDFVDIAIREALGLAQTPRNVPVYYRYDDAALRAWLQTAAAQYNYAPIPARVDAPPVPVTLPAQHPRQRPAYQRPPHRRSLPRRGFRRLCPRRRRRLPPSANCSGWKARRARNWILKRPFPWCWRRSPQTMHAWPTCR